MGAYEDHYATTFFLCLSWLALLVAGLCLLGSNTATAHACLSVSVVILLPAAVSLLSYLRTRRRPRVPDLRANSDHA